MKYKLTYQRLYIPECEKLAVKRAFHNSEDIFVGNSYNECMDMLMYWNNFPLCEGWRYVPISIERVNEYDED